MYPRPATRPGLHGGEVEVGVGEWGSRGMGWWEWGGIGRLKKSLPKYKVKGS